MSLKGKERTIREMNRENWGKICPRQIQKTEDKVNNVIFEN